MGSGSPDDSNEITGSIRAEYFMRWVSVSLSSILVHWFRAVCLSSSLSLCFVSLTFSSVSLSLSLSLCLFHFHSVTPICIPSLISCIGVLHVNVKIGYFVSIISTTWERCKRNKYSYSLRSSKWGQSVGSIDRSWTWSSASSSIVDRARTFPVRVVHMGRAPFCWDIQVTLLRDISRYLVLVLNGVCLTCVALN